MPRINQPRNKRMADAVPVDAPDLDLFEDDGGGKPSGHWYRSELAFRIPRRYRKTRGLAILVFGATKAVGTGGGKVITGAGRGGLRMARGGRDRARQRRAERRWSVQDVFATGADDAPDLNRHFGKRFGGGGLYCSPCGTRYRSMEKFNDHFLMVHMDDEPVAVVVEPPKAQRPIRSRPKPQRAQPQPIRRPAKKKRDDRMVVVLAKYRDRIDEIGARAMSTEPIAQQLRATAARFAEQNPTGRSEMYLQVAAMEKGLAALREGIETYAMRLRRPHRDRTAIAVELVRPDFKAADEALENAERALARFVARFEDINGLAIRVAQGELPNGGTKFLGS